MHRRISHIALMLICLGTSAADTILNPPQIAEGTALALNDVTVDPSTGAQYIVGTINETVDLNPGVGDVSRTPAGGVGDIDAFIIKLAADGKYEWGHTFGGAFPETCDSVVLTGGFVYMAGTTPSSNAGFDGATGTSGTGAFICAFDMTTGVPKATFDSDGHAEYVAFTGGAGPKLTFSGGDLFLGGRGVGAVAQVAKISAASGALDMSFSSDGLQTFGGGTTNLVQIVGVAADASRVYMAGTFNGTGADIGATGTGTINALGMSTNDIFLVALSLTSGNADINFSGDGVQTFGGTDNETLESISVSNGNVFVGGILNSINAGFGGATGAFSKTGNNPDAVVFALDSTGTPVPTFDVDGVVTISPPVASGPQEGSVSRVRIAAEFGVGVATPGIAIQLTQSPSSGISNQVVVSDLDSSGAKRPAFGINGEIKFDSTGSELGQAVVRSNGRTTIAVIGSNNSSFPVLFTKNLIPRVLEFRAKVVASFSSDTGAPQFPAFTDIHPRASEVASQRTVMVMGSNFPAVASIAIEGNNMTGLMPVNSSKITGVVPASTSGTGDKSVTLTFTNGRTITTPNGFAYDTSEQASGSVVQGLVNDTFVHTDNCKYFVGTFGGTKDFDPGPGVDMQRSVRNNTSAFLTKINADGSYGWTSVFVGLGRTNLNSVVVKGDRVYAVGDFQPDTLTGVGLSCAGINGLGDALCQGNGDGAVLVFDRISGLAITAVSNDGIKIVGGSTDTSFTFGTYDSLHCIAASPTANVLAVSGRMLSTDVGFDGSGVINANDSAFFCNFDTDCNPMQNVVKDYPLMPPSSNVPSALCTYTPDGSKLMCAAFSGDQIDLYQFSGNVGTPANTFGTAGTTSIDTDSTISSLSLDSTVELTGVAWANSTPAFVTVANADGTKGTLTGATPVPGQTPAGSVDYCELAFDQASNKCVVAFVCNGDVRLSRGAATKDIPVERVDEFDNNLIILASDLPSLLDDVALLEELADSAQICKGDGGGAEDCKGLFSLTDGVGVCVSSTPPSTVVRLGTQEATPGNSSSAVFTVVGGGGGGGTPPTITSPLRIDLIQGEEFVYEMTATGSPTIVFNSFDPVLDGVNFNDNNLKSELDKLGPAVTVTQVGNKLHILCRRPDQLFFLTINARNFALDQKTIVCKSHRNPKAPKITIEPLKGIGVPSSGILLPFTVTGDEPLKVISPGYATINNGGGNYAINTAGSNNVVFYSILATNPFGEDYFETVYTIYLDSDGDKIPNLTDPDNDNDGIPDSIEASLGTVPLDPNSPSGVKITTTSGSSTNKKTTVTVNNSPKTPEVDSIFDEIDLFEGTVISISRAAPKPAAGVLIYDFGGVSRMFVINEKGTSVSGSDKCSVKLKLSKGQLITNVKISIKNANVKAALTDEGLTDRNAKNEAVSVNTFLAYNGVATIRTVPLLYTAKQGKKGSAKLKK